MNNEEKILSILEKMDDRLSNLENAQSEMNEKLSGLESRTSDMEGRLSIIAKNQITLMDDNKDTKRELRNINSSLKGLWEDVLRLDNRTEETRKMVNNK